MDMEQIIIQMEKYLIKIWKNEKVSVFGVCYLQDGYRFYIGYLDNHKRNSFGIYKEKPNIKMIGYWKDDQMNGHYVLFNF